jgi:hypothetical protein
MVDLKRFHFAYDRPAVLLRWTDRKTVFNLGRSFFGCIMWSKQDAFQIQYGVDTNVFPMVFAPRAFTSSHSRTQSRAELASSGRSFMRTLMQLGCVAQKSAGAS